MIVMKIQADNLFSFEEFSMEFSYPKKIVNSCIENEYLISKPNFRYKKVNILMGANASGKTSIGKLIMSIASFLEKKEIGYIEKNIANDGKLASFSFDFLLDEETLYRAECELIKGVSVDLRIYKANIAKNDSYESCVKKLKRIGDSRKSYSENLNLVPKLGYIYPFPENKEIIFDVDVLKKVLTTLDNSILDIVKINEAKNGYVIKTKTQDILLNNGNLMRKNILSTGTKAGIDIAYIISSIKSNSRGFYYCDEKFSFIQTDVEQALLSIMISLLKPNMQLFFTTHNLDLLELNLPRHAFSFLKKER